MALLESFLTLLFFLRDLGVLIHALLSGKLRVSELWKHILDVVTAPIGVDKAIPSGSNSSALDDANPPQPTQVVDSFPDIKSTVSHKHTCAVSGLCRAIVQRDVDLVNAILGAAPSLATTKHSLGYYPLAVAALSGVPELVQTVLSMPGVRPDCVSTYERGNDWLDFEDDNSEFLRAEFSSNPNHRIIDNASALHYACISNNPAIVWAICRISNDFRLEDKDGKTPIDYIDCSSQEGIGTLRTYNGAFENWKRKQKLFDAISLGNAADAIFREDYELLQTILRRAPHIAQEQDASGWTLLHVAVMNQFAGYTRLITDKAPSSVNIRGRGFQTCYRYVNAIIQPYSFVDGATALHIACFIGNLHIAGTLLRVGADWKMKDDAGRTPEDYLLDGFGESYVQAFKRMCEEEEERRNSGIGKKGDSSSDGSDTEGQNGDGDIPSKALDLEQVIGEKIVGQQGPVRSVASTMRLRENGWIHPYKPLVMLFLGSSGVGKTELAKQLALYKHGKIDTDLYSDVAVADMESDCDFVRIDMSEYQHDFTVSNLTGPPKGYVGYDEGGFLTRKLHKNPGAIVLLDEIERAHPDVLTVFLQLFDEGRITDTKNGVIYCEDAVFIMTSNLAAEEIKKASPLLRKLAEQSEERPGEYTRVVGNFVRRIHPILKGAFKRDEFLGRINETVVFLPLTREAVKTIINKELTTWKKRAEEKHGIDLTWSAEVVQRVTKAYNVNFGARSVIHEVQRIAIQEVAEAQIRGTLKKNSLAYLTTNELGNIELRTESREGRVRDRRGCRFHLC